MTVTSKAIYDELDRLNEEEKFEEAEEYLRQELSEHKPCRGAFDSVIVTLQNELGIICRRRGKWDQSIEWFKKAEKLILEYFGEQSDEYATLTGNLADTYRLAGNSTQALPLFLKALRIYEKSAGTGDYLYATALNNTALVYKELKENKTAIAYCLQALEVVAKLPDTIEETITTYLNLSELFKAEGMDAEAEKALEGAADIIQFAGK